MKKHKIGRGIEDFLGTFVSAEPRGSAGVPTESSQEPSPARLLFPFLHRGPMEPRTAEDVATSSAGNGVAQPRAPVPVVAFLGSGDGDRVTRLLAGLVGTLSDQGTRPFLIEAGLNALTVASRLGLDGSPPLRSLLIEQDDQLLDDHEIPTCRVDLSLPSYVREVSLGRFHDCEWIDEIDRQVDVVIVEVSYEAPVNARRLIEESDVVVILSGGGSLYRDYQTLKSVVGLTGRAKIAVVGDRAEGGPGATTRDRRIGLIRMASRFLSVEVLDLGEVESRERCPGAGEAYRPEEEDELGAIVERVMSLAEEKIAAGSSAEGARFRRSFLRRVLC